jgi:fatty acid synthase subunit alpha, fungi type
VIFEGDLEPTLTHATTRNRQSSSRFLRPQISGITPISADKVPLLHLKRKVRASWEYGSNLTGVYLNILHEIATSGTIFKDKNVLLTGVGTASISVEIFKSLLSGGAHVVITTLAIIGQLSSIISLSIRPLAAAVPL